MATKRAARPNEMLRAVLEETGWTHAELARAVNAMGTESGTALRYDRSAVAHWLGGARPRAEVRRLLAEAFTRRLRFPVTQADLGWGSAVGTAPIALPGSASSDAVDRLAALSRPDADLLRRATVLTPVYSMAEPAVVPWSEIAGEIGRRNRVPRRRVGGQEVASLRQAVRFFAAHLEGHGGGQGHALLAVYLSRVVTVWLNALGSEEVQRRLLVQAARLSFLGGRMHLDAWEHGTAQRYFRLCLDLAAEADDRVMYAIGLRALSAQAGDLDHRRHALCLAQAAADSAGVAAGPAVQAFVHAQCAVAGAGVHDRPGALAALRTAERKAALASDADPDDPFACYPAAALRYQAGRTLAALEQYGPAAEALRTAAERGPAQRLPRALSRARLAATLLHRGYLEEACEVWQGFLDDYPYLTSGRAERELRAMKEALRPYRRNTAARAVLRRAADLAL